MTFVWTDEAVAAARRFYMTEGLSAAETARRIGATRSAVIGKAHRLGWAAERDPALAFANLVRAGRSRARDLRRSGPAPRPPLPAPAPVAVAWRPRPWMQRRAGECAFPVAGDGEAVMSCCAPCGEAGYCAAHTARMYLRRTAAQMAALDRLADWVEAQQQPRPRGPARREAR